MRMITFKEESHLKPFNIGDIVYYEGKSFKGLNIIMEVSRTQGSWSYSSQKGAWLEHNKCKLVKKSNARQIELTGQLFELQEEYESNSEDKDLRKRINKLEKQLLKDLNI